MTDAPLNFVNFRQIILIVLLALTSNGVTENLIAEIMICEFKLFSNNPLLPSAPPAQDEAEAKAKVK